MRLNISIIAISLFFSFSLGAQSNSETRVPDENGNIMLPKHIGTCETITFYDESFSTTLPENKVNLYENKITGIINLFLNHSLLTPPTGFGVRLNKRITQWNKLIMPDDFPVEEESKLTAEVEIALSPYFLFNNQPAIDFHNSTLFNIYLNNPYNIAGTPLMADIYPCPRKVDEFYGADVFITDREEVSILNYSGKPIFLPVSQEEFIQTLITYWKSKIEIDKTENEYYSQENKKFNSEEGLKQRDREFKIAYNELLKYDKNAAEELKKQYEEIQKLNSGDVDGMNINEAMTGSISFEQEQISKLKQELAEMSLYERNRQAYYSVDAFEDFNNVSGLLPESHKNGGDALVRINPQLIDDNIDAIQLVCIQWHLMNIEHFDSPRLTRFSSNPGRITDNKTLKLYSDKIFWNNLFEIIKK